MVVGIYGASLAPKMLVSFVRIIVFTLIEHVSWLIWFDSTVSVRHGTCMSWCFVFEYRL
jgi:hypothetical protein